jgi:hypothetical protein
MNPPVSPAEVLHPFVTELQKDAPSPAAVKEAAKNVTSAEINRLLKTVTPEAMDRIRNRADFETVRTAILAASTEAQKTEIDSIREANKGNIEVQIQRLRDKTEEHIQHRQELATLLLSVARQQAGAPATAPQPQPVQSSMQALLAGNISGLFGGLFGGRLFGKSGVERGLYTAIGMTPLISQIPFLGIIAKQQLLRLDAKDLLDEQLPNRFESTSLVPKTIAAYADANPGMGPNGTPNWLNKLREAADSYKRNNTDLNARVTWNALMSFKPELAQTEAQQKQAKELKENVQKQFPGAEVTLSTVADEAFAEKVGDRWAKVTLSDTLINKPDGSLKLGGRGVALQTAIKQNFAHIDQIKIVGTPQLSFSKSGERVTMELPSEMRALDKVDAAAGHLKTLDAINKMQFNPRLENTTPDGTAVTRVRMEADSSLDNKLTWNRAVNTNLSCLDTLTNDQVLRLVPPQSLDFTGSGWTPTVVPAPLR